MLKKDHCKNGLFFVINCRVNEGAETLGIQESTV